MFYCGKFQTYHKIKRILWWIFIYHHLDPTIYICLYSFYHLYQLILFFDAFQSKLKTSIHSLCILQHSYDQLEFSICLKFFFWCKIYIQWNTQILSVHPLSFDEYKPPSRYRTLPSLQIVPPCPFPGKHWSPPSHSLSHQETTILIIFHYRSDLPVLELYMNGIIQFVSFCGWLLSLSIIFIFTYNIFKVC